MSQGNKYEGRVPGVPDKAGIMGTAAWRSTPRNPLPPSRQRLSPVASPRPAGKRDSPPGLFVFFSPPRTTVRSRSTSDAATRASTRISAANRRQNHKNFALRVGAKGESQEWVKGKGQRTCVMRRLVTLTAGTEKQRGRPRTRKQSLTEPKHEKRGRRSPNPRRRAFLSPPDSALGLGLFLPTHGASAGTRHRRPRPRLVLSCPDSSPPFWTASAPRCLLRKTLPTR